MNSVEKTLARILFRNRINQSDGNAFEDLFTRIMNYAEHDFQQIKPWGNIGDRKNDGYIKSKGIFYQVFAPEEIQQSYPAVVKKLLKDFDGLKKQWSPVNEFYFVVNDKYKGVNADSEKNLKKIKKNHKLKKAGFITTKHLENILFKLEEDQITNVVGFLPDPQNIKILDYSVLNEVVAHIMSISLIPKGGTSYNIPDWSKKIKFNKLSKTIASYLNSAYIQVGCLEEYLKNNGDFLAEELKDKLLRLYLLGKKTKKGDKLFMYILAEASPKAGSAYQNAVLVIMAKYFEVCDIFEEPTKH